MLLRFESITSLELNTVTNRIERTRLLFQRALVYKLAVILYMIEDFLLDRIQKVLINSDKLFPKGIHHDRAHIILIMMGFKLKIFEYFRL
jgi:hypothetical protein